MCDAPSLYATRAATLLPISLSLLLPLAGVPTNFVRAQSLRRPGAGRAGRSRSRPGAQPGAGRAGHCVRLQCWHTQGTASVRPKCERCDAILASSSALLEECASTGEPTPGTAKEIFGKLFAVPLWSRWPRQCFSLIIPLVQRCNDARDTSLNNALREMLRFLKIILHRDNLPSRTSDSVSPSDLRSWSAPTPARAQVSRPRSRDSRCRGPRARTFLRGRRVPALACAHISATRRQLHLSAQAPGCSVRAAYCQ